MIEGYATKNIPIRNVYFRLDNRLIIRIIVKLRIYVRVTYDYFSVLFKNDD